MKIAAYQGETLVPEFDQTYLCLPGILQWLQGRLGQHLEAQTLYFIESILPPRQAAAAEDPAPRPLPAKGGVRNRNNKRKSNAQEGASKRPKTILPSKAAELDIYCSYRAAENPNNIYGVFLRLNYQDGFKATPAREGEIFNYLLAELQAVIRGATFQIQEDDGSALIGSASLADGAERGPILDSLSYPPFASLARLSQVNRDKAELNPLIQTGKLPRAPYICRKGESNAWNDTLDKLAESNKGLLNRPERLLWIPDRLPNIYYDPIDDDRIYELINGRYTYQLQGTPPAQRQVKVPKGSLPFYTLLNGALWPVILIKPSNTWPTDGIGGQGAMRCDAAGEFEHVATDGGRLLGRALGLAEKAVVDAVVTLSDCYRLNSAAHQITYSKAYLVDAKKRNAPKATRPLSLSVPIMPLGGKKTSAMRALMMLSGFTKKRKGMETAGEKAGEKVIRPIHERLSANGVMRADIVSRFGTMLGGSQDLGPWLGSATDLVAMSFNADAVAQAFWAQQSAGLRNLSNGQAASDIDKSRIRTDQEWCHLFGHGDGGEETADNFVAGSKHCNTEQLALELTQRLYRDQNLTVKVTAYLMPSGLPCHTENWNVLRNKFGGIEQQAASDGTTLAALLSAAANPAETQYQTTYRAIRDTLALYFKQWATRANSNTVRLVLSGQHITAVGAADYKKTNHDGKEISDAAGAALRALFPIMPIAYMMRYKVYVGVGNRKKKAIDHIYSGQREEMDFYEFQLLRWLFRMKIASAISSNELKKVTDLLEAKIAK